MNKSKISNIEFITLMASLMAIAALSIDALLPAISQIGLDVGIKSEVDSQLLVIMIFLGLGVGQLFFGSISDSLGRKPVVFMGFGLFIIASLICVFATDLPTMLLGRVLQGVGLSSPRSISIAMVRDTYSGDYMARIMSFITVVFLLVPVIAPALGKFILDYYNWQAIFYMQLILSIVVSIWFWIRQPETLLKPKRIQLSKNLFSDGFLELIKYKRTLGFTVISGFIMGSFMVYLSTTQTVFQMQYNLANEFPLFFAGLSVSIGISTFLNGTLVLKYGMEKLVSLSLLGYFLFSLIYVLLFHSTDNPPIEILLMFFGLQFFTIGFLFGNLRALAMEPVGHIAGIASAITGFISTIMSVPISIYIGKFVVHTALPIFAGFTICGLLSILILIYLKIDAKKKTV